MNFCKHIFMKIVLFWFMKYISYYFCWSRYQPKTDVKHIDYIYFVSFEFHYISRKLTWHFIPLWLDYIEFWMLQWYICWCHNQVFCLMQKSAKFSTSQKDAINLINIKWLNTVNPLSWIPCFSPDKMGLLDPSTSDGRIIFFLPWQKHTLAGKD